MMCSTPAPWRCRHALQTIVDAEYPRFSDAEMARRRAAIEALLKEAGCDHLVFCGANRFGSSVQWLTGWPVTTEAVGVLTPGEADAMFVQHVNHAPLAQKMAARAKVVWGGGSSIGAAVEVLERRAAQSGRVAVIGPMTFEQHATLAARFGAVKNLNRAYTRLRQVKSAEEIDWMRIGAALSDRGMIALRDGMRPGLSERELGDLVERAYVPLGGTTVIHFIGVTAMADPQLGVPTQFASSRRAAAGDIVFAEISAAFWDHPGQVLRSFALGDGADRALSRPARRRRRRIRCGRRRAQGRRHAAASDRSRKRDRGRRLHHHRRSAARLWRRLSAAGARLEEPPERARAR